MVSTVSNRPCRSSLVFVTALCWMACNLVVVSGFAPTVALIPKKTLCSSSTSCLFAQRRGRPKGPLRTIEVKPTMNDEIKYDELRVVTPNPKGKDEPLGIMSKTEALAKAKELGGLDVILINENSSPPVCKIVDYSKYRYMKEKKAKELKKNSKATEVKEVKMSYKIDVHDYGVRRKNASKFISQGNRVKITIMFRGREVQHDKLGYELIDKLAADLEDVCLKEGRPVREGRNLSVILTPRPEVVKAVNEGRRAVEKKKKKKRERSLQAKKAKMEEKLEQQNPNGSAVGLDDGSGDVNNAALEELSKSVALVEEDEEDLESSLDDLLGGKDIKDDLFA